MHHFRCAASLLLASCASYSVGAEQTPDPTAFTAVDEVGISHPPYGRIEASWKQRLEQPYVYVEANAARGDFGRLIEQALAAAAEQDLEVSGPPFGLYEHTGEAAAAQVRMRACLPVGLGARALPPLAADVLASETVAYAYLAGPYPGVHRAYSALCEWMRPLDWVPSGPAREIYLVDPSSVRDVRELVTELQIPVAPVR